MEGARPQDRRGQSERFCLGRPIPSRTSASPKRKRSKWRRRLSPFPRAEFPMHRKQDVLVSVAAGTYTLWSQNQPPLVNGSFLILSVLAVMGVRRRQSPIVLMAAARTRATRPSTRGVGNIHTSGIPRTTVCKGGSRGCGGHRGEKRFPPLPPTTNRRSASHAVVLDPVPWKKEGAMALGPLAPLTGFDFGNQTPDHPRRILEPRREACASEKRLRLHPALGAPR